MGIHFSSPIKYWFILNGKISLNVNNLLGKQLIIKFTGKISCINCNRNITKSFRQGYCFPCTQKLAVCDFCILNPYQCHYHKGTCRDPAWGLNYCFVPHIVYLADSSDIKVGLTRETQLITRWIDQGAIKALPIIRTKSRYQAGLLEFIFNTQISDKTNWRKMLLKVQGNTDLINKRDELCNNLKIKIQNIALRFPNDINFLKNEKIYTFNYPILQYSSKIISLNLEKLSKIDGVLLGIKGQYLILDCGVINIRKYIGYEIELCYQ